MCASVSISSSRTDMAPNGTTRGRRSSGGAMPPQGIIYAMRRVHALLTLFSSPAPDVPVLQPPAPPPTFDVIIRGGMVYDGTGSPGRRADIGIKGDRIERIGDLSSESAKTTTDATGKRRRAGLHQHALVGDRIAARRRPLAGRHSPGRDARDLRRRQLHGPAQRRHEETHGRGDGRHQVRASPGRRWPST